MLVDQVVIHVYGGKGGNGCASFRREKYVPKGGPDGGDGGHGGAVYLVACSAVDTLLDLAGRHHWRAEDGEPGSGANRAGRRGAPLDIRVPPGTLVYDAETGVLLKDMVEDGQRVRVARGGRGGYGNLHFTTPTNQAPRQFTCGRAGQTRTLRLELKLIADVGFVGLPNAGKSTLLSRLSRARPKIAAYPFTTLSPNLGIMELPGFRRLVLADIPGLIEGAHAGAGLGFEFLRHIERTRVIVHLVDICPPEGTPAPLDAYRVIREELFRYSPELAQRHELVAANKMDLTDARKNLDALRDALSVPVYPISGVSGAGLRELGEAMWEVVAAARRIDEERRLAAARSEELTLALATDAADDDVEPESAGDADILALFDESNGDERTGDGDDAPDSRTS